MRFTLGRLYGRIYYEKAIRGTRKTSGREQSKGKRQHTVRTAVKDRSRWVWPSASFAATVVRSIRELVLGAGGLGVMNDVQDVLDISSVSMMQRFVTETHMIRSTVTSPSYGHVYRQSRRLYESLASARQDRMGTYRYPLSLLGWFALVSAEKSKGQYV